jgi:hypothetical protein
VQLSAGPVHEYAVRLVIEPEAGPLQMADDVGGRALPIGTGPDEHPASVGGRAGVLVTGARAFMRVAGRPRTRQPGLASWKPSLRTGLMS